MSKCKVELDSSKLIYGSIRRYSDGYSYASVVMKVSDNETMHINYEWEGDGIPEFAMNIMDMLKNLKKSEASISVDSEIFERASRVMLDNAENTKEVAEDLDKV